MKTFYDKLWELIEEGKSEVKEYLMNHEQEVCAIGRNLYTIDADGEVVFQSNGQFYEVSTDIEEFLDDASTAAKENGHTQQEYFDVLQVSREDFYVRGYDAACVSDDDMTYAANKIGDVVLDGGDFWLAVDDAAEYRLGLKKYEEGEYLVRYERLNAEDGEVKEFSDFFEAKAYCKELVSGMKEANGKKDKCPQIRYYVTSAEFDKDEGPSELYTTQWYWE